MVASRDFAGIPIKQSSTANGKTILTTASYTITIDQAGSGPAQPCAASQSTDIQSGRRISSCGEHEQSCLKGRATQAECCGNCTANAECKSWIFQPSEGFCFLMAAGGKPTKRTEPT